MLNSNTTVRVDILSDVVCPWCAIGYHQLARAAADTDMHLNVRWHPFELNPGMVEEGENLREHLAAKYGTTPEGSRQARARLTDLGAGLGFAFNYADDMRMWNTFRAHQLIEWAEQQGCGHKAKLALLAAYFTERQNISDIKVLVRTAESLGLDGAAAQTMLLSQKLATQVRSKQRVWIERGVRGVPSMIFEGRFIVTGAQGAENYRELLEQLKTGLAA